MRNVERENNVYASSIDQIIGFAAGHPFWGVILGYEMQGCCVISRYLWNVMDRFLLKLYTDFCTNIASGPMIYIFQIVLFDSFSMPPGSHTHDFSVFFYEFCNTACPDLEIIWHVLLEFWGYFWPLYVFVCVYICTYVCMYEWMKIDIISFIWFLVDTIRPKIKGHMPI